MAAPAVLARALGTQPKKARPKIGLARNAAGVDFHCRTCEYFDKGTCQNPDPELKGVKVKPEWCCDLYDHQSMKVLIP